MDTDWQEAVLQADARSLPLADHSVDLIVTSPPYFLLRDYDAGTGEIGNEPTPQEFVNSLISATEEMSRVLKTRGSIWVNLGDKYNAYNASRGDGKTQKNAYRQAVAKGHGLDVKGVRNKSLIGMPWRYALRVIDDLNLVLRQEIIWEKIGGLPEHAKDRSRRSHETWFHITKSDRYHVNKIEMEQSSVRRVPLRSFRTPPGFLRHPATFPGEWVRWIIEGWCPEGGVVLDPFGGSGTTAMIAERLGRLGISSDLSHEFSLLARHRITTDK